jgi:hypothetical protein
VLGVGLLVGSLWLMMRGLSLKVVSGVLGAVLFYQLYPKFPSFLYLQFTFGLKYC